MLTCKECLERMKPDDPRVRSGRYHVCGCDYCNKPTSYRELEPQEEAPVPQEIIHRHSDMSSQDFAKLRDMEGHIKYLQATIEELKARRKPQQAKPKPITTSKPAFKGTV